MHLLLILLIALSSAYVSRVLNYAFRMHPGEDIQTSLANFAKQNNLKAASISTCVGNV